MTQSVLSDLLDLPGVRKRYGNVSKAQIYRKIGSGELPEPIKFGRLSRWRQSDIDAALARLPIGRLDMPHTSKPRR